MAHFSSTVSFQLSLTVVIEGIGSFTASSLIGGYDCFPFGWQRYKFYCGFLFCNFCGFLF